MLAAPPNCYFDQDQNCDANESSAARGIGINLGCREPGVSQPTLQDGDGNTSLQCVDAEGVAQAPRYAIPARLMRPLNARRGGRHNRAEAVD